MGLKVLKIIAFNIRMRGRIFELEEKEREGNARGETQEKNGFRCKSEKTQIVN